MGRPGVLAAVMNVSWAQGGIAEPTSILRNPTTGFREAAILYINAGGERRYLDRLVSHFGEQPLAELNQAAIDAAGKALLPHAAASTVNRQVHGPASAVLKYGAAHGWCHHFRVKRPRGSTSNTPIPTPDELDRFVKAAGPSLKRVALFLLYSGATVGDALQMEWHQVDLAKRQLCLPAKRQGGVKLVSLHPRLVEMLGRMLHRNGRVFRRPDGSPYQTIVQRGGRLKIAFRGACLRAGVPPITPRTLRRVWVARQAASDADWDHRNVT